MNRTEPTTDQKKRWMMTYTGLIEIDQALTEVKRVHESTGELMLAVMDLIHTQLTYLIAFSAHPDDAEVFPF